MANYLLLLFLVYLVASAVIPRRGFEQQDGKRINKYQLMKKVKGIRFLPENRKTSCFGCTLIVDGIQSLIKENKTDQEIAQFFIETCDFLELFASPYICDHLAEAFMSEVIFVLERTLFTPDEICGAFVPDCGHAENPLNDLWNITIPGNKPPIKPWPTIPNNKPSYRFLHLTDIHIDRQYAIGSEAYCEMDDIFGLDILCCRNYPDEQKGKPIYVPSQPWGMNYACDLPFATFEALLDHVSKTHTDLDYIVITGDFEAHDVWDYTEDLTVTNYQNITDTLLKYFPTLPIYLSVGNHEGVPCDAFPPHTMQEYESRGPQWLYSTLKKSWANWIPNNVLPDVQYRASYAINIKPGLKLISLNTVYCSMLNFYLYIDQTDPDSTLEWLIEQLLDSESKGERVHLISHIPPGADYCLKGWSWNFFKIIERFENTIAQQFYGHTHYDHFQVYYETANPNTRPFHFNWISPSVTTSNWANPAYRIFTVDGGYEGATYNVKEAETYATDLNAANQKNSTPVFNLEYRFTEFYNMTDLSPQSFSDLSDRLWSDKQLFRKFIQNYYRGDQHDRECYTDDKCRASYVCVLKRARSYDNSFCTDLK